MVRWQQKTDFTKLSRGAPEIETQSRFEIEGFRRDPWVFSGPFPS